MRLEIEPKFNMQSTDSKDKADIFNESFAKKGKKASNQLV